MPSENEIIERIDRHSRGSLYRNLLWLLFRFPGSIILWFQYYFPSKGRILISARQRGSAIMEIIFSLGLWLVVVFVATAIASGS